MFPRWFKGNDRNFATPSLGRRLLSKAIYKAKRVFQWDSPSPVACGCTSERSRLHWQERGRGWIFAKSTFLVPESEILSFCRKDRGLGKHVAPFSHSPSSPCDQIRAFHRLLPNLSLSRSGADKKYAEQDERGSPTLPSRGISLPSKVVSHFST